MFGLSRQARLFGSIAAPAITALDISAPAARPSTRFGVENNTYWLNAGTAASVTLGTPILGANNWRIVKIPATEAHVPASTGNSSGDFWIGCFFRTAAATGLSTSARQERLFTCDGGALTGAPGGAFQWDSLNRATGSSTTGQAKDTTNAGSLLIRRQGSGSYQFWAPVGTASGLKVQPDTAYFQVHGTKNVAGSDFGRLALVTMADNAIQTAQAGTASNTTRPTTQALWSVIGAMNAAGDHFGFGGSMSDYFVVNGPFPSDAQIQALAAGTIDIWNAGHVNDIQAVLGGTVVWYNRLDFSQVAGSSLPSVVGAAATVDGTGLQQDAVLRPSSALTIDHKGNFYVFPRVPGAATGAMWIEGTGTPGRIVEGCFSLTSFTGGGQSAWGTATVDGTGRYAIKITVPKGTMGRPRVRYQGDNSTVVVAGTLWALGAVVDVDNQSQGNIMMGSTVDVSGASPVGSEFSQTGLPLDGSAPWACFIETPDITTAGYGYRRTNGMAATVIPMVGGGLPGDAWVLGAKRYIQDASECIMYVCTGRSGTPIDAWTSDKLALTRSDFTWGGTGLAGSGYTTTITASQAAITAALTPILGATDAAAYKIAALYRATQVRKASLTITLPGGVVVTEKTPGDTTSPLTGTNVDEANSSINYMTGAVVLVFNSAPPTIAGATVAWTTKQETIDSSSTAKTANINSWGVREAYDGAATLGFRYGVSCGDWMHATANQGDANTDSGMYANMRAKGRMIKYLATRYIRSDILPIDPALVDFPLAVCIYGRDGNGSTGPIANNDQLRYAHEQLIAVEPWASMGGNYYDNRIQAAVSPHQDFTADANDMIGERNGAALAGVMNVNPSAVRGPEWDTANVTIATTTNANDTLRIPAIFYGGDTALAVPAGGDANNLDEWYFGGAGSTPSSPSIMSALGWLAKIEPGGAAVLIIRATGAFITADKGNVWYVLGGPGPLQSPPVSLLFGNRGAATIGGYTPPRPGPPAARLYHATS